MENGSSSKRLWERFFVSKISDLSGTLKSSEDVDEFLKEYELETCSRFVSSRGVSSKYGKDFDPKMTLRLRWQDARKVIQPYISFDGVPFVIMGRKCLSCHHDSRVQVKKVAVVPDQEHDYGELKPKRRKRKKIQSTKKLGCPAIINIRHVVKFPDYKIETDNVYRRRMITEKLNIDIKCEKEVKKVHCFYIELPDHHENHITGEDSGRAFYIDAQLSRYLHELVQAKKVFSSTEAKDLLGQYLELEMFKGKSLPPKTNRRYWPSSAVIRAHMATSRLKLHPTIKRNENISARKLRAKTKEKIRKLERFWHDIADNDEKVMEVLDEKLTKTLEFLKVLKKKDDKSGIVTASPPRPKNKVYAVTPAYATSEIVPSYPPVPKNNVITAAAAYAASEVVSSCVPVTKNKVYAAAAAYAASEIEGCRGYWGPYYPTQGHPGSMQ